MKKFFENLWVWTKRILMWIGGGFIFILIFAFLFGEETSTTTDSTIDTSESFSSISITEETMPPPTEEMIITTQHEHRFLEVETIEATYESPKTIVYNCEDCGKIKEEFEGQKISPVSFKMSAYSIDFLGGITFDMKFQNNTNKEIKYIHYTLQLKNAVGDVIHSEMYNSDSSGGMAWKYTGPLPAGCSDNLKCNGFYNNTFSGEYILRNFTVIFMDGTCVEVDFRNRHEFTQLFLD